MDMNANVWKFTRFKRSDVEFGFIQTTLWIWLSWTSTLTKKCAGTH